METTYTNEIRCFTKVAYDTSNHVYHMQQQAIYSVRVIISNNLFINGVPEPYFSVKDIYLGMFRFLGKGEYFCIGDKEVSALLQKFEAGKPCFRQEVDFGVGFPSDDNVNGCDIKYWKWMTDKEVRDLYALVCSTYKHRLGSHFKKSSLFGFMEWLKKDVFPKLYENYRIPR